MHGGRCEEPIEKHLWHVGISVKTCTQRLESILSYNKDTLHNVRYPNLVCFYKMEQQSRITILSLFCACLMF